MGEGVVVLTVKSIEQMKINQRERERGGGGG